MSGPTFKIFLMIPNFLSLSRSAAREATRAPGLFYWISATIRMIFQRITSIHVLWGFVVFLVLSNFLSLILSGNSWGNSYIPVYY